MSSKTLMSMSTLIALTSAAGAGATDLSPEDKATSAFHILTGTLSNKAKDEKRTADKKALAEEALGRETKLKELVSNLKKQLTTEKDARKKLTLAVQLEDANADLLEISDEQKAMLECQNALEFHFGDFTIDTAVHGKADAETDAERKAIELVRLKKNDVVTLAFGEAPSGDCGQIRAVPTGKKIKVWVIPSKSGKLILLPPNGWEEAK